MWRARGASTSTTADVCSPRPIRRHHHCSSPPRPPACAGSLPRRRWRFPRCLLCATSPPTSSFSSGSTRVAAAHPTSHSSAASSPNCTGPVRPCSAGRIVGRLAVEGCPTSHAMTWAEFYGTQRLLPLARLAHGVLPPAAIAGLELLGRKARRVRRRRRTARSAARRSVGRQSSRRCSGRQLVDRPGGARRASRVRPGDDAPVRRLR